MSRRAKVLIVVLVAVLAASLFYLRTLARRIFFQIPQQIEETARTRLSEVALQAGKGPQETAVLYFPSYDEGKLLPETRAITWASSDTDRIKQVLLALIEGSQLGHGRALPPSTMVRAVFLTPEGTAYVDFSNELQAAFAPGVRSESLAVYSVVNSVTKNIVSVKSLKILIQGQEVESLDGHADLTEAYAPDPTLVASGP